MDCRSCGQANRDQARFCDRCGAALQAARSDGSAPDTRPPAPEPRSYTPKHLAEKILTSRSAMEGERKHVTVMFADVKGSMDLAGQVDVETWHRIHGSLLRRARRRRAPLRGHDQSVYR